MRLTIDTETRSRCDLKKCGSAKYAEDESTEILCLAMKQDDRPSVIYTTGVIALPEGHGLPLIALEEVCDLVSRAEEIEAHNVSFEQDVWHYVFHRRGKIMDLPPEKLRCSASRCAMCSLPRSLGQACQVLNVSQQKDSNGYSVMMRFCKPVKTRKTVAGKKLVTESWHNSPEDFVKLCRYCMQDVEAEYALSQALPPLPPKELAIWKLDGQINRRGVRIDTEAVISLQRELAVSEKTLLKEWRELTRGTVDSPTQIDATLAFIREEFGRDLEDLTKRTVEEELAEQEAPF